MVIYRVYSEFCRKQIHFRKAAVERNDFKVKKEAACSQLQMGGLWLKSISSVSAQRPFVFMLHPHTLVEWCLWSMQS